MKRIVFLSLSGMVMVSLLLTGCANSISNTVHKSVKSGPEKNLKRTLIFLPADIAVKELTASGMAEEVPEWSELGKKNVEKCVNKIIVSRPDMDFRSMPELSEKERDLLDQYVALYHQVAGNALSYGSQEAWKNFRETRGYTLGSGLDFLCEKTEANGALVVTGLDLVSSGGRQVSAIAAAALGVYIPMGFAVVHAGVIDFKTGNILWMNTSRSDSLTLKNEDGAKQMLDTVFANYMDKKK